MTIPEGSTPPVYPTTPVYKKDSSLAVASLVCGLLGWTFVPVLGAIAAIITGHMAKKEIRESNGMLSGDGMALAGLLLGYISLGLLVMGIICFLVFFFAIASTASYDVSGFSALLLHVI